MTSKAGSASRAVAISVFRLRIMTSTDYTNSDINVAFEELRREVSLTRAALEGLTAARERIPDYTATLGAILEQQKSTGLAVSRIMKAPAISLSPDAMVAEISKAGTAARAADAKLIHDARDALSRSIGSVDMIVARGHAINRRWEEQIWTAIVGLIAGILLWSFLPGTIARAAPATWHLPEWMAARMMGREPAVADLSKNGGADTHQSGDNEDAGHAD